VFHAHKLDPSRKPHQKGKPHFVPVEHKRVLLPER
jgi:hypothetical protein